MKSRYILLFILINLVLFLHGSTNPDTLIILHTTDVHGNLFPYDYITDTANEQGLIRINSRVKYYRENFKQVLLLDGGDLLQGTAFSDYYNKMMSECPHPLIAAYNYMEYDAFTVGNHEVELGLDNCKNLVNISDFPWLSANSCLTDGTSYFEPYTVIRLDEIYVGIMGLTTPGIPKWIEPVKYPGITWEDMVETADDLIQKLTAESDICIGLFHSGFDKNQEFAVNQALNLPPDNSSGLVAEHVPGFDVILGGHSHRLFLTSLPYLQRCFEK